MADGLIMFVHGLGGSAVSTWGRFPELIAADARFDGYDVGFFECPTSLFRIPFTRKQPRIQTLGDALATTLDVRYRRFAFQRGVMVARRSQLGCPA